MGLNSKIKSLIFACCSVVTIAALAGFASSRQNEKKCEKVSITIDNEYNNYFIGEEEVRDLLTREGERKLEGLPNQQIDLKNLEKRIEAHSFVKEAEVFKALDGNIQVSIKQNRPIARIIRPDQDVYIDAEGNMLPLSERYTARVIPITKTQSSRPFGRDFFQDSTGQAYLSLLRFIETDQFWKAQLAQMHIDEKGRISFLPQVGEHTIEFGKPDEAEQKFKKLMVFYKEVLPVMGWDKYKRVNVEYEDQIICE
ncbi:cell division protein FtsQ [Pontibacter virosus]|uniref:Cell division protein FtsQ n=1 Tax=Pontibacter virosus TaxID=1765052 RepID=A0A2U1AXL5_9BACT|nr:cell division protein FtsQ [Pontibacter virosus]